MDLPESNNDQSPLPESGGGDVFSERPVTALEERQQLLAHHVRLVARKMSHALFVYGAQGGLGKSRTILRTLDGEGIQPVLINSHVTPLALFGILFQHREDSVIFFDDTDSLYSSMPHLGLLRSALWGFPRVVTYNSSQLPGDLPPRFEFTGRCIFCANVIPKKNDAFKAVLSRCDIYELTATDEEVIDRRRAVSAKGFDGLTPDDCAMMIDYIAQHAEDRQLSLRLLGTSLRKLKYARSEGLDWRPLVKSQLQTLGRKIDATKRLDNRSKDMRAVKQALEMFPSSVQDQQEHFCKVTGKSRASFYRALARFREEQGE
jgi:hypothetical protein